MKSAYNTFFRVMNAAVHETLKLKERSRFMKPGRYTYTASGGPAVLRRLARGFEEYHSYDWKISVDNGSTHTIIYNGQTAADAGVLTINDISTHVMIQVCLRKGVQNSDIQGVYEGHSLSEAFDSMFADFANAGIIDGGMLTKFIVSAKMQGLYEDELNRSLEDEVPIPAGKLTLPLSYTVSMDWLSRFSTQAINNFSAYKCRKKILEKVAITERIGIA